ncbi:MAG: hypothetical protein AAF543_21680, partial [Pseudomonadota bacterium]
VVGGTGVFGWVLDEGGYQEFHLTIARHVELGAGRPLFDEVSCLDDATRLLKARDLTIARQVWMDKDRGLELVVFRRTGS